MGSRSCSRPARAGFEGGGGDGRFAQIAGFSFTWAPGGTAQVLDESRAVTTPGTRIVHVELEDGTVIVEDGLTLPHGDLVGRE